MKFDLPILSQSEIDAQRLEQQLTLATLDVDGYQRKLFTLFAIIFVVGIFFIWKSEASDLGFEYGLFAITYVLVFYLFVFWPVKSMSSSIQEAIKHQRELLQPIHQKHCADVIEWCKTHPQLAAFQSEVAKQGRMLTNSEFYAMQEWVTDSNEKQREVKELDAFEALKMPTA